MNLSMVYLMWDMVKRDFRSKYAGSAIGILWNLILPIAYIIVYTTVFSQIMIAKLPNMPNTFDYSVYLSSGLLAWTVFNSTISRFQNVFIENSNIVKKIYFPKTVLLYSVAVSSIIELIINYSLLFIVLLCIGYPIHINFFMVFGIIILQQIFCMGIGLVLSVLTVHFRDLSQLVSIVLPIWFWVTPIVYVRDILPNSINSLINYNPLYYFIESYQKLIMEAKFENLFPIIVISLISFFLGMFIYRKMIDDITDLI
jgi:lipopolysaccharide transport system permease protein